MDPELSEFLESMDSHADLARELSTSWTMPVALHLGAALRDRFPDCLPRLERLAVAAHSRELWSRFGVMFGVMSDSVSLPDRKTAADLGPAELKGTLIEQNELANNRRAADLVRAHFDRAAEDYGGFLREVRACIKRATRFVDDWLDACPEAIAMHVFVPDDLVSAKKARTPYSAELASQSFVSLDLRAANATALFRLRPILAGRPDKKITWQAIADAATDDPLLRASKTLRQTVLGGYTRRGMRIATGVKDVNVRDAIVQAQRAMIDAVARRVTSAVLGSGSLVSMSNDEAVFKCEGRAIGDMRRALAETCPLACGYDMREWIADHLHFKAYRLVKLAAGYARVFPDGDFDLKHVQPSDRRAARAELQQMPAWRTDLPVSV